MALFPGTGPDRAGNNLLRRLRPEDWELLAPRIEEWSARLGTVLYSPGDDVRYAYMPCEQSLISYLVILSDGQAIETALVGREGAIGGIVSQGRLPAYARAEVQLGGSFYRIELQHLEDAKRKSLHIRNLFARYADCLMAQVFQGVACNASHNIEQRTAKWLVAAATRTGSDNVELTQEQLASMLGVGRSYLSRVIHQFREDGMIQTRRGRITISDMEGLCHRQCECNATIIKHFEEVLEGVYPTTL